MGSVARDLVASSTLGCVVGQALSSPNPSLGVRGLLATACWLSGWFGSIL